MCAFAFDSDIDKLRLTVDVERGNGDGAEFWVRSVLHPTG